MFFRITYFQTGTKFVEIQQIWDLVKAKFTIGVAVRVILDCDALDIEEELEMSGGVIGDQGGASVETHLARGGGPGRAVQKGRPKGGN